MTNAEKYIADKVTAQQIFYCKMCTDNWSTRLLVEIKEDDMMIMTMGGVLVEEVSICQLVKKDFSPVKHLE